MNRDIDYRTTLDHYAEQLLEKLVPGASIGVELIGAQNPTKASYNLVMPSNHPKLKANETFHGTPIGTLRFAKPRELVDEEHAVRYEETIEELAREHERMRALRTHVRERVPDLPEDRRPSIWIPEVYETGDEGFVRQFIAGKHVTRASDYSLLDASHLLSDMLFMTEEIGMAGFGSVRNDLYQFTDEEIEELAMKPEGLRTELIHHFSPHVGRTVLSPTSYDELVTSSDPGYFAKQQRDFFDADGLRRLARKRLEVLAREHS